jgi:hypothetical protein
MVNNNSNKSNPFLLSNQVKTILRKQGFSSIFNYNDYTFFKDQCKSAFNKAQAIADKFKAEAEPHENDFQEYIF